MNVCPLCGESFESETHCPKDGIALIQSRSSKDLLIGTVLKDTYRVESLIGEGGMGVVYKVTHLPLNRTAALKILLPKFQTTPEMVRRFLREGRILSQVSHPNIVGIYDFSNTPDGLVYMVIEYLEGMSLQDYVPKDCGLEEPVILELMYQICAGCAAAHQVPLIHRDLKPDNIFIAQQPGQEPRVKILDFGISKILGEGDDQLTQIGIFMGTPGYIAPEQISEGSEPGIASDIYALGSILYFMLGGKAPFHEFTGRSAMFQQVQRDPTDIPLDHMANEHLKALFPVVLKAMHRDPKQRYESATSLYEDLARRSSQPARTPLPIVPIQSHSIATHPTILLSRDQDGKGRKKTKTPKMARPKTEFRFLTPKPWFLGLGMIILLAFLGYGITLRGWFQTPPPLIFGMSADFSGSNREIGREMQLGIQVHFKEINAEGGIKGRKLELIALDDGYEPEPAKENTRDLLDNRGAFALIGNVGTPTAEAVLPLVLMREALFFAPFSGASLLRNTPPDRYIFNYRASYQEETAAAVEYFVSMEGIDPKAIAVFSQNDAYGDDGFHGVVRAMREYGVAETEILHVRYQRNHFDVEPAVKEILAQPERARAIVTIGTYKQTARFIQDVKAQARHTRFSSVSFVGARALADAFRESNPAMASGVIITQVVPFYQSSASSVMHFRHQLARFAPNEQPGFVSLEGYLAAQILCEALRRTPQIDTESLIDTLESMKDLDIGTGTLLSFGPSNHQASNQVWAVQLDEDAKLHSLDLD